MEDINKSETLDEETLDAIKETYLIEMGEMSLIEKPHRRSVAIALHETAMRKAKLKAANRATRARADKSRREQRARGGT